MARSATLTLEQLAELDYGDWHDDFPQSADELMQAPGVVSSAGRSDRGLLTLEALLGLVKDTNVKLFVETKHPVRYGGLVETKLVAALARHGLVQPKGKDESRIVMMSFSARAVRRFREYAPRVPTVLLLDRMWPGRRDGSLPHYADYTGPGVHLLRDDPEYVARAATAGTTPTCGPWTTRRTSCCVAVSVSGTSPRTPRRTRDACLRLTWRFDRQSARRARWPSGPP